MNIPSLFECKGVLAMKSNTSKTKKCIDLQISENSKIVLLWRSSGGGSPKIGQLFFAAKQERRYIGDNQRDFFSDLISL